MERGFLSYAFNLFFSTFGGTSISYIVKTSPLDNEYNMNDSSFTTVTCCGLSTRTSDGPAYGKGKEKKSSSISTGFKKQIFY
ncbi:hypothetical protein MLD52_15445 [Puniceicoccaceae bacterium K14]|nr:hypothetical protein [Puniceicoccaceae bacterium K14]